MRVDCVVGGDTFWYRGAKIRIADINAPEVSEPHCAAEARLGARATTRMAELLNAGAFTLAPADRARDVYGRKLFTVTRAGASLGARLEAEGLAEHWRGYRRDWCAQGRNALLIARESPYRAHRAHSAIVSVRGRETAALPLT